MRQISASEAKQTLSAVLDAAQREPVVIQRQNRDVAVLLSIQDYERLAALNIREFQTHCDLVSRRAEERGMTDETLEALLRPEA